jgi:hypothetical protein
MSRAPSWYINGVSLAGLGFLPEPTGPGRRSGLAFAHTALPMPGRAGQLPDGFGPTASPRTIVISGEVKLADRDAVLTSLRTILAHAGRGTVELRCVDAMDRVIHAVRDGSAVSSVDTPSMLSAQRTARVELRFTAHDPCWRDRDPQDLAIGQVAVALPLGALLPSPFTLEIYGSVDGDVENPQVLYADAEGATVQSVTLTGTLTSWATDPTSMWRISTEGPVTRIRKRLAGVWANDDAALTAGALFALDPADGWTEDAVYPTLRLFDAAARATGRISFRRRHEL